MGRGRIGRGWGVGCAALMVGCGASSAKGPAAPPVTLPAGAAEVAALRGHSFRRSVPVEEVTRARMRHVIGSGIDPHPPVNTGEEIFLKAFGFIPQAATVSAEASVRLQGDALVGLYVPSQRTIYVRPRTRTSSVINPDDITHELEHALQDDVFGLGALDAPVGDDERLARRAVYEGDATVVAWGIAGMHAGKTAEAAIAEHRAGAVARSATLGASQEVESVPGLSMASPLTLAEMYFPYTAGGDLAAEAFLAGGAPLVDGLFRKLPTSTEQVLHVEKYFRGESPIPVRAPLPPAGYTVLTQGTMGELRTRAFLELALPSDVAVAAASGWGGDAYAVVAPAGGGGPAAVLWSTIWDDEPHAVAFEAALSKATPPGASALGPVSLHRQGTRVAWMRGLDDTRALTSLLSLAGPKPPDVPPHGHVVLVSTQVGREILVPAGGDPHLVVARLGIAATLPARFAAIRAGTSDLTVQDTAQHGRGTLAHTDDAYDPRTFPAVAEQVATILAASIPIGPRTLSDISLPLGQGKEARWPVGHGEGEARFIVLPICGGNKTLVITTVARSEESRVSLAQWLRSIEPTGAALPPLCTTSDP